MAQEYDNIISLLREMQIANNSSNQSFDRLLTHIATKLDMTDNTMSATLVDSLLKELKRSVDDKFTITVSKFEDIQNALKTIYGLQNDQVKNSDMREFFDIFTKNVNNFYTEAKQNKALLSTIEVRLSELINNKSDKDDILRTISLLRKDFENLNNAYRTIIDDINTNIKSIISALVRLDPTKTSDQVMVQIDAMYNSLNDVVLKLQDLEAEHDKLEQILSEMATEKDLKITNGMIESLIEKAGNIEDKLNELANKEDAEYIKESADILNQKADSLAHQDDINELTDQTDKLITQVQDIKQVLAGMAQNIEQMPEAKTLEDSLKGMYSQITTLNENIDSSNVKGDVFDLNMSVSSLKEELLITKNIVNDLNEVITTKIQNAVDSISFADEAMSIKTTIAELLSYIPQKEDIERLFEENTKFIKNIIEKTDSISEAILNLPSKVDFAKLAEHNPAIKAKLEELSKEQQYSNVKLSDITTAQNSVGDKLDLLFQNNNITNSKINEFEDSQNQLDAKIDDLSQQHDSTDSKIDLISQKQNSALSKMNEISSKQDEVNTKFEGIITNTNNKFDKEFSQLYNKAEDIEEWLQSSSIKENFDIIISKLELTSTKDDIAAILKYANQIAKTLDIISESTSFEEIKSYLPILNKNISGIKDELLTSFDSTNLQIIDKLSSLDAAVTSLTSADMFKDFIEELKDCLNQVILNVASVTDNLADLLEFKDEITEKISNIDFSNVIEILNQQFNFVHDNLQFVSTSSERITKKTEDIETSLMSISEYIHGNLPNKLEYIQEELDTVKKIISKAQNVSSGILNEENEDGVSIKKYLEEIKNIVGDTSAGEYNEKLEKIENSINNYNSENELKISKILDKINSFEEKYSQISEQDKISEASLKELKDMKVLVAKLEDVFKKGINDIEFQAENSANAEYEKNIADFIALKLKELYLGIDDLVNTSEDRIKEGFAYNSALLEEKTENIIKFINEIEIPEFNYDILEDKISQVKGGLSDLKQELQLVNSDIIDHLSSQTERFIDEFIPIKDMIDDLHFGESIRDIKTQLEELHSFISDSEAKSSEELYNKVLTGISESEAKIKDFIIGDTDSVIIKIDNLKEYLETALKSIVPPSADEMAELQNFKANIEEFKKEQFDLINLLSEDMQSTLKQNHEELKSMISVAVNHEEIIDAIENLKKCFNAKLQNIASGAVIKEYTPATEVKETEIDTELKTETTENIPTVVFDDTEYKNALRDLKNDYVNYAKTIEDLAAHNNSIEKVLGQISKKIDMLSFVPSEIPEDGVVLEDDDLFDDEGLGENSFAEFKTPEVQTGNEPTISPVVAPVQVVPNFDFEEAFNLLKGDILNLKENVDNILQQEKIDPVEFKMDEGKIIGLLSGKIEDIMSSVKENWLNDVKTYLKDSNVESVVKSINNKLEDLTIATELAYSIDEKINKTDDNLKSISKKLDELAVAGEFAYSMDEKIDETDNNIKNIVKKIDELTNAGDLVYTIDGKIEDANSGINNIDKKLSDTNDVVKILTNKLTDLSSNITSAKDDISNKFDELGNNNDLLDEISKTLDSQIADKINIINAKLDVIATTNDNLDALTDVSEAIEDVDIKIVESDAQITSMLEVLNTKLDIIVKNGGQAKDIQDVKNLIDEQKIAIEKLEPTSRIEAFKKCLDELAIEVGKLAIGGDQLKVSIKDMKESIMSTVVSIFDQISFSEESEDIKGFVEEKTDVINKNLEHVTKQLKQLGATGDMSIDEYTYSMHDIETDLAKLRLALNDLQNGQLELQSTELNDISEKLRNIIMSVDVLKQDELKDLKEELSSLKEQTRFLIATSDKSYNAFSLGMEGFEHIIDAGITQKVNKVEKMLADSANSDNVIRQSLIYMGEWIDSASESINKISANSENSQELLNNIEKQFNKIESIERKFEEQENKINRLEMSIDKVLSAIENIDDTGLTKKIDKIEKQMAKLSTNIEKLASYVE